MLQERWANSFTTTTIISSERLSISTHYANIYFWCCPCNKPGPQNLHISVLQLELSVVVKTSSECLLCVFRYQSLTTLPAVLESCCIQSQIRWRCLGIRASVLHAWILYHTIVSCLEVCEIIQEFSVNTRNHTPQLLPRSHFINCRIFSVLLENVLYSLHPIHRLH